MDGRRTRTIRTAGTELETSPLGVFIPSSSWLASGHGHETEDHGKPIVLNFGTSSLQGLTEYFADLARVFSV
jgi:hypothetical protein